MMMGIETRSQLSGAFAMKTALVFLSLVVCAVSALAATDVRVNFTLSTTDENGAPITENRYYYVYRPDGLSKATPVPMVLVMDSSPATFFHRKADQAGFVVVSCSFSGNSTGTPGTTWDNHNPCINGFDDMDYTTEVINRVKLSDNANDAFICGISKGGHMAYAYACVRPATLRAACSVDSGMGLPFNLPTAPLPIIAFHGTSDGASSYTMGRATVDAWRMLNGLLGATAVMTYESAPLMPGKVLQTTWRGGICGTQTAFVTIEGGTHRYALPGVETGYDCTDGMWAFLSQFLTSTQAAPKIVAQPVNNVQMMGCPASFWVVATGNPPLAYQWQRNGVDIPGAASNWHTTPTTTLGDNNATFRAVVSNGSGNVTSTAAILTVKPAPDDPRIAIQPANRIVTAGQPVSFTVTAVDAAPLTYQWKKNGIDIVGQTAESLTLRAAIDPDSGAAFSVVVSNGSGSVTSAAVTPTVKPAPGAPIIITNPDTARVLTNQTGIFSVGAWSRTPISYQWQKGPLLGNMADIPGATAATYTTPTTTLADNKTTFRCVVSNAAGSATSAGEELYVTAGVTTPKYFVSPITASAHAGDPFRYIIVSSGGTTPIAYSASPLPAGLSVNAATGVISGTPIATGTTKILMTAGNSAGSLSAILVLTITLDPPVVLIEAWRLAHFGASATNLDIAGDSADPDGDGVNNLLEYTNGTDPLAADASR
jgi:poly(3-hydroxybutyrate) depolymerase